MSAVDEDSKLDRREAAQVMRRAARMLRPYKRDVVGAMALVTVSTLAVLAGPFLLKVGIDRGISAGDAAVLNLAVVAFVVVAVIAYVASRIQILMISRSGEGFLRDLRNRVFDHLLRLSMPFYDREKAGVVVSRMTSDVDSLQELIQQGLLQMLASMLLIVGSVIVLGIVCWQLLLVCLIPVPFVILASIKFQRDSNEAYLTVRDRIGLTLSSLQEGISGVRVIQAYGREDVEIGRFQSRNNSLYRAHMKSVFVQAWYLPVIEGAAVGCTALVVALGGKMVVDGTATVGTVAFFVLTLSNLFEPLQQLSQLFNTVQSSGAALQKLFELLDTPVDLEERPGAVPLPDYGELRVEGLSFAYGSGPPVLSDVDLVLPIGEKLALVGPTGAGKSTLAKLMARLYDPTAGRVTFAGIDLRDAQLLSLRTQITVVPQEGYLFHGSIRDNVRIGRPDATDRDVEDALESLGLLARFSSQANGLDTEVNERGSSLSAGERQLVSLARAALADPAVLVLDEATSSLDPGTEVLVERALERLVVGRTVIVIAHRLSTAERSDRVGVVADGRLAELGTHAELVGQGGRYAQLYDSWVHGLASSG
ncbi:ABC transporter ATP-binding protein [Aquihabitans daechungensis]|uniref:ABC transporter ATP-binding protein n=1 Tax=Aquihabitans daechungensis TaxID=1052257 RepID=UPI003B9E06AA